MTAEQYGFNIAVLVAGGPLRSAAARGQEADGEPGQGGSAASNGKPPSGSGEKGQIKGVSASKGDGAGAGK